jgi:hypothetical protein
VKKLFATHLCCHDILPKHRGPGNYGMNPLKPQVKTNLFSIKLFLSGILVTGMRKTNTEGVTVVYHTFGIVMNI